MQPAARTLYPKVPRHVSEMLRPCPECGATTAVLLGTDGPTALYQCGSCEHEFSVDGTGQDHSR